MEFDIDVKGPQGHHLHAFNFYLDLDEVLVSMDGDEEGIIYSFKVDENINQTEFENECKKQMPNVW